MTRDEDKHASASAAVVFASAVLVGKKLALLASADLD